MSGDHFGYAWLEVFEFVERLEGELNSSECNEEVTPEVRKVLEKMLPEFRQMAELMKLCKKLFSGDCGSQSFLERVNEVQGQQGDMKGVCKEGTYHPLVDKILYGNVVKSDLEAIKEKCILDSSGNIDHEWYNSLDEEQVIRLQIAATVQQFFNKS